MAILRHLQEIPIPDFASVDKKSKEVSVYYKTSTGSRRRYVIGESINNGYMYVNDNLRSMHPDIWELYFGEDNSLSTSLNVGLYAAALALATDTGLYYSIQKSFGDEKGNALLDYAACCIESKSRGPKELQDYFKSHVHFSIKPLANTFYADAFANTTANELNKFKQLWLSSATQAFDINSAWLVIDKVTLDSSTTEPILCAQILDKAACQTVSQITAIASGIGIPLTWHINQGHEPNANDFEDVIKLLKGHDIEVLGVILDSELNSPYLNKLAQSLSLDWVIKLESDSDAHKHMLHLHAHKLQGNSQFYTRVEDLFGTVDHVELSDGDNTCVALFCSQLSASEKADSLIKRVYAQMDKLDEDLDQSETHADDELDSLVEHDLKRFIQIEREDGKVVARIDHKALDASCKAQGYFSVASSATLSATEIIRIYKLRDAVAQTFTNEEQETVLNKAAEQAPTGLGLDSLEAYSDPEVQAKLACSFIASAIRSLIAYLAKEDYFTADEFLEGLSYIKLSYTGPKAIYSLESAADEEILSALSNLGISSKSLKGIASEVNRVRDVGAVSKQRIIPHLSSDHSLYGLKAWSEKSWLKAHDAILKKEAESQDKDATADVFKRKPGRPKGSKNKKTLEREALEALLPPKPPKKRGRPKGSKNKSTLEREALMKQQEPASEPTSEPVKRGRGRPKGSKNKKTLEREALLQQRSE